MKGKQIINNRRASYDYRLGDKIVAAEEMVRFSTLQAFMFRRIVP